MLDETVKLTLKDAAQKLTGPRKRAFMAKVAEDYFGGSARKAESRLGWKRQSVQLGTSNSGVSPWVSRVGRVVMGSCQVWGVLASVRGTSTSRLRI